MNSEQKYLELLLKVKNQGTDRGDRTGTGTRSIFGHQIRFDLQEGFPLLTTKKVFTRGIIHELLWFISGDTNIKYLVDNGVHIWDDWPYETYTKAREKDSSLPELSKEEFIEKIKQDEGFAEKWGDIGPAYGYQWRNFNGEGVDQIQKVIDTINNKPESRRIMVVAYNPSQADYMLLPPCHSLFQFYVADGKLSCQMYQRSADLFIGVPFNIASYSILTHMIAHVTNLEVGEFIHTFGDTHIYHNHFEQVDKQLSRTPTKLPELKIKRNVSDIFSFKFEDFEIEGYDPHPAIKAPIAV